MKLKEGSVPTGDCEDEEIADITFLTEQGWNLTFQYVYQNESKKYHMSNIALAYTVNATNFPGASITNRESQIGGLTLFPTPIGKSCAYEPKVEFPIDSNVVIEIESYNAKVFLKSTPIPGNLCWSWT